MRNRFPLLLLVLAAAVGVWLLVGGDDEGPAGDLGVVNVEEGGKAAVPAPLETTPTGPGGLRVKGRTPVPRRNVPVIRDPRTLPKGTLLLTLLGPDLKPIDARSLRVYVEPGRYGMWRTRLGLYDPDTLQWRFADVVAGAVRVRIQGDHIVGRTVKTTIKANHENELSVTVDRAGAIKYDVIAYDKKRPAKVKLILADWQGKAVNAWYQERAARRLTTPSRHKTVAIGPEGVIFGILPGRYTLRVVSTFDEWDEAEVDVVAGKTVSVSLEVRR